MTQTQLEALYSLHIQELQSRTRQVLQREQLDALVIHSGQAKRVFLDDMDYPFKVNPHFKHWLPVTEVPNSWLVVNGEDKPKLIYYQPNDFWHKVIELRDEFWLEHFDIQILTQANEVEQHLPRVLTDYAYIGEHLGVAKALGFEQVNPEAVLNYLHYHRAYKTDYEHECLRRSTEKAVKGHIAAKQAFLAGRTEFEINQAYLNACLHDENQVPYTNIIALNENAAILHYMVRDNQAPKELRSFLIDAGASYNGYASDITRTYSLKDDAFADLVKVMDDVQQKLVKGLKPQLKYGDLHVQCHLELAHVLEEFGIINIGAEQAVEKQITRTFFPHGLGHHLGLQVHDVGGFMADVRGTHVEPPKDHPYLRTTREVEVGQVFTIEPGLYFIDSLLAELKDSSAGKYVNWNKVDAFKPYGGIRIEDNVIVHHTHNENMTRNAGLD
ncbi:Xaa-Pro dipeptidase [Catenovulum sp. SM1970]|uniref:Xaa-Pro dipeptidase n=1 Tax=Marinifaba aquimaris TaxID=2741323 RepID=UPI00157309FF|nr:Xaa-Pro dipeptidase [Marinifaba aquimaris]NTS77276.1 Xaa-Pro dipeptidase [Marinifaba aquimaris]